MKSLPKQFRCHIATVTIVPRISPNFRLDPEWSNTRKWPGRIIGTMGAAIGDVRLAFIQQQSDSSFGTVPDENCCIAVRAIVPSRLNSTSPGRCPMRNPWLLALSASVLWVGISAARQQKSNTSSVKDPRAAVPAGLEAPANKMNERSAVRGFAAAGDDRTSLPIPPDPRALGQSDRSDRSYQPMGETPRSLITPATQRDPSLLRVQPGEKVNKIPEAVTGRQLATQDDSRQTLLPSQIVPGDRHGVGDR